MITRLRLVAVCSALTVFLAHSAVAEDSQSEADLRCLVVALGLGNSTDPNVKSLAPVAAMYYIGRLEGHDPKIDLEARLTSELTRMSAAQRQTESRRCGTDMAAKAKLISEIGKDLQKKGL